MQLAEHIIATCFIGRFDDELCRPVPETAAAAEGPRNPLFKIPDMDEDMRALPMDFKPVRVAVRGFALGESEISRKSASWEAMLKGCFVSDS
jgi:hypothetical protein